ncbi:MAG: hypothetical protein ACRD6W_11940, partial [Nitrososphaerales archaeon]
IDELEQLGLVASRTSMAEMIRKWLATLAADMQMSEQSARRYVDDERLRELARQAAVEIAEEQPGADLRDQARTIPMSLQLLGRTLAGLAESAHIRVLNADEIGAHGSLQLISLVGQILHERRADEIEPFLLPQAALTRGARLLEASALIVREGGAVPSDLPVGARGALAQAFVKDAKTLRSLVSEHGTSGG